MSSRVKMIFVLCGDHTKCNEYASSQKPSVLWFQNKNILITRRESCLIKQFWWYMSATVLMLFWLTNQHLIQRADESFFIITFHRGYLFVLKDHTESSFIFFFDRFIKKILNPPSLRSWKKYEKMQFLFWVLQSLVKNRVDRV